MTRSASTPAQGTWAPPSIAGVVGVWLLAACSSGGGSARIESGANDAWGNRGVHPRAAWTAAIGGVCSDDALVLCPGGGGCCPSEESCCDGDSCAGDCSAPSLPNGCPDYAPTICEDDLCCPGSASGSGTSTPCSCPDVTTCCADGSCGCGSSAPPLCATCPDGTNCCADGSCGC